MVIAEKLQVHGNNFDFLRFLAASLVILGHSFALNGIKGFEPLVWASHFTNFGELAVNIFFVISGFLITKSWIDNPRLFLFLKKRCLRILPALVISVILCLFIIGPLSTTLELRDYFARKETWRYLSNILLYPVRFDLPGVFANNPHPNAVNGSLWTLPIEFTLYGFVALLGITGVLSRGISMIVVLVALFFFNCGAMGPAMVHGKEFFYMSSSLVAQFSVFFCMGSAFYLYREKIALSGMVSVALSLLFLMSFRTVHGYLVSCLTIPYVVMYIAFADIPLLHDFGKFGDFSYGMYVYAFPVQQTLVHFFRAYSTPLRLFAVSFLITLCLAALSWHLIEKPALKLKKVVLFRPANGGAGNS